MNQNVLAVFYFLVLLICSSSSANAQRTNDLRNSSEVNVQEGIHTVESNGKLYFAAFHESYGYQLFESDDDKLNCISCSASELSAKAKRKAQRRKRSGKPPKDLTFPDVFCSRLISFNNAIYFFAEGQRIKSGIYTQDGNQIKMLYPCLSAAGNFVIHNNSLTAQVVKATEKKKVTASFMLHISETNSIEEMQLVQDKIEALPNLIVFNENIYSSIGGLLSKLEGKTFVKVNGTYGNPHDFFVLNNQLFYMASTQKYGPAQLMQLTKQEQQKRVSLIGPNNYLATEFPIFYMDLKAYYLSNDPLSGCWLYVFDGVNEPLPLKQITSFESAHKINGLALSKGQFFVTFSDSGSSISNLYRIDKYYLNRLKPNRLSDIANVHSSADDGLVFTARRHNQYNLYYQLPAKATYVMDTAFTVFEFWDQGKLIGVIGDKIQKSGRLEFEIIDGNPSKAFKISRNSGELYVSGDLSGLAPEQALTIQVTNKNKVKSITTVNITVKKSRNMSIANIVESLMFYPSFREEGVLKTKTLKDGTIVSIFDINYRLVDEVTVRDGRIKIGAYDPGLYFLNVVNTKNLYQKIELK